jgi:hypothetical protein
MKKLLTMALVVLLLASCCKQHPETKCGVVSGKAILENSIYRYFFNINGYSVPVDSVTYIKTPLGAVYCSEWLVNYSRT